MQGQMVFALILLSVGLVSPATACSDAEENCNVTRCCNDPDLTCYEKNVEYANCDTSCKKGVHDTDVGKWKTPWSCKILDRDDCSAARDNCNVTKCCKDDKLTCYEKNKEYAECMRTCRPGIHMSDAKRWRTSWSCNVLKAGLPDKKAAIKEPENKEPDHKQDKNKPEGKDLGENKLKGKKKSKCGDVFDKCGGMLYKGETCCLPGCKCHKFGSYHSSCQPITGHGHSCLQESDLVMVEINDAAAKDTNLDRSMGWLTASQLIATTAVVGTIISFVIFLRRARRQHLHIVVHSDEPPARQVQFG